MQRTYDVRAVREQFPALQRTHNGRRVVYLDGPGGSQVAKPAIEAVSRYMNRGGACNEKIFAADARLLCRGCSSVGGEAPPGRAAGECLAG